MEPNSSGLPPIALRPAVCPSWLGTTLAYSCGGCRRSARRSGAPCRCGRFRRWPERPVRRCAPTRPRRGRRSPAARRRRSPGRISGRISGSSGVARVPQGASWGVVWGGGGGAWGNAGSWSALRKRTGGSGSSRGAIPCGEVGAALRRDFVGCAGGLGSGRFRTVRAPRRAFEPARWGVVGPRGRGG